jgi:DNA helicase HerA-like ATPase
MIQTNLPKIKLPSYDERVIFLGGTGSGKTNLALTMLNYYRKVIYIDTQHNLTPKHDHIIVRNFKTPLFPLYMKNDKHIVYRPPIEQQTPTLFNEFLYTLHKYGKPKKNGEYPNPFIIYIDEAYSIGYGANFPLWATKIAVLDRQKGIGLWTASQRPVNIPVPLRSECAYYYVFYLSYDDDIDEISKYGRPKNKLKEELLTLEFDHSFIQIARKTGSFLHYTAIKP